MKAAQLGLGYALLLFIFAGAAAGSGHGFESPIVLFYGPAFVFHNFLGLIWPFLIWPYLFWLTANRPKAASITLLAVEIASIAAVWFSIAGEGQIAWNSRAVRKLWPEAAAFYALFVGGQILLWLKIVRRSNKATDRATII